MLPCTYTRRPSLLDRGVENDRNEPLCNSITEISNHEAQPRKKTMEKNREKLGPESQPEMEISIVWKVGDASTSQPTGLAN